MRALLTCGFVSVDKITLITVPWLSRRIVADTREGAWRRVQFGMTAVEASSVRRLAISSWPTAQWAVHRPEAPWTIRYCPRTCGFCWPTWLGGRVSRIFRRRLWAA